MVISLLTSDYEMKSFDCGDADLNDFLLNDAKLFAEKRIAYTYVLEDGENIVGYYSLLNDKVSKLDASNSAWKSLKMLVGADSDKHTRAMHLDLMDVE